MFEQFLEKQPKFCQEIDQLLVKNNKISHAYLIETNSFTKSRELVFAFAKMLLCPQAKEEKHTSSECSICRRVDNNEYPDFMVIEPEGAWIKKEQLLNLKTKFKTKSYSGNRRVYVIFQAEKLNKSSANTLLKFLEEPEEGIIAILVTSNRYQVLRTILSRCQVISFLRDENREKNPDIDYSIYISFLENIYKKGSRILCNLKELWYTHFKTKEEYIKALQDIEDIYQDLVEHFDDPIFLNEKYGQAVQYLITHTSLEDAVTKIKVIENNKSNLIYNVNLKLWLDSFIIQFSK